ncbi:MAG: hypothetical protein JWP12_2067 [Bacteroidetes bacterium]|nr:hypothetical protein [Bacteroidota bacterium]
MKKNPSTATEAKKNSISVKNIKPNQQAAPECNTCAVVAFLKEKSLRQQKEIEENERMMKMQAGNLKNLKTLNDMYKAQIAHLKEDAYQTFKEAQEDRENVMMINLRRELKELKAAMRAQYDIKQLSMN